MTSRRLALTLALCTSAVLAAMVIVSMVTGATQEAHEYYTTPIAYAAGLLEHPGGLAVEGPQTTDGPSNANGCESSLNSTPGAE